MHPSVVPEVEVQKLPPGAWVRRSACRGGYDYLFKPDPEFARLGEAREVCYHCRVRLDCRRAALNQANEDDENRVQAGMTLLVRKALRAARPDHPFETYMIAHAHDVGFLACEHDGCTAPYRAHPTRTAEMTLPDGTVIPPGPWQWDDPPW